VNATVPPALVVYVSTVAVSYADEPAEIDDDDSAVVVEVSHASAVVVPTMSAATAPSAPAAPPILYLRLLMSSFLSSPTD
jgi:hypothetical protein